jgi:hypothetical protein
VKRKIAIFAGILFFCASCSKLDVVGDGSIVSFEKLLNNKNVSVVENEKKDSWILFSSDSGVKLVLNKNYDENSKYDVALEFNAKPFIDAGLDVKKLPEYFTVGEEKISVGAKFWNKKFQYGDEISLLETYKYIVKNNRDAIGYHAALDHYGINLGNGNVFEWAKDLNNNDKDIVFALEIEPLVQAGADLSAIAGWTLAKVPVDDKNAKPIVVDKLLKIFDL